MTETSRALDALAAPLRRRTRAGHAALALGGVALVLGLAAWGARLGLFRTPAWVLGAWGLALAAAAALLLRARRGERAWLPGNFARVLEALGAARPGALTGMLAPAARGTSEALLALADRTTSDAVRASAPQALAPVARRVRTGLLLGGGAVLLGGATLGSAGPARGPAAALWHPVRAWDAARAPVRLAVSDTSVDRGARVRFDLTALGRREAQLWLRAPGEAWHAEVVPLDDSGHAVRTLGPLTGDLFAHLTSGGRSSDTVLVKVRLPVFLGALTLTAHYPGYLGLADEPLPVGRDTLIVPAGTRLETRGEATAPLARAGWTGAGAAALDVDGAHFHGMLVPAASGVYRLDLATTAGGALAGDTVAIAVRVVADSAPRVEIPVPGADTVMPVNLALPLVIDARDDHGVTQLVLESRKVSRLGQAEAVVRETIALPAGTADRAIVPHVLHLEQRGLAPGDSVRFSVLARDNAPAPHVTRSREFVIRLETLSQLRAEQRRTTAQVAATLDSLAKLGKKLERSAEDLANQKARGQQQQDGSQQESLTFDEARKAEAIVAQQQEMEEKAQQLKDAIDQLRKGAEAAGTADSAWQKQLGDIQKQLDRAMSPDLRKKLEELQQALKELNPERAQEALKDLAKAQQELREALERSKELFRRAALEGDLQNLSQESKELAKEQQKWSEQVQQADSGKAAAQEQQLAERADSLASALEEVGKELAPEGKQEAMAQAAQQAKQASQKMKQAAKSARQGQKQQAKQEGEQAAEEMKPLADELDAAKKKQQEEWREEVVKALDRALAESSRLTERELGVQQQLRRAPTAASRNAQAAVEEGTAKLLEQLRLVAGKNALVSPQILVALATAQKAMGAAREAISTANANPREASDRAGEAIDALNVAAYQMLRSRGNVNGSESGSGMAEAMQQMAKMAQQQGQLGQQAAGMLPQAGGGQIGQQLKQLGQQQRQLAEQLEKMRGQGNMPGAGAMAEEAKELARTLEGQRLDRETVERQERLFKRMLDAGRSLQGQEKDEKKERESTTAKDGEVAIPPALREKLADEAGRLRVPSWDELQKLSPGERRLVADYFRRLAEAGPK